MQANANANANANAYAYAYAYAHANANPKIHSDSKGLTFASPSSMRATLNALRAELGTCACVHERERELICNVLIACSGKH